MKLPKSVISDDLKIDNHFLPYRENWKPKIKIDAFFIPTQCQRENLPHLIIELLKYTSNIYVLASHESYKHFSIFDKINVVKFNNDNHQNFIKQFKSTNNPSYSIEADYDLPTKRNFALQYSMDNNYDHIALIDDDIFIDIKKIKKAACILERDNRLVGFYSTYFPDKSVISLIECYLERLPPKVSLSGSCLFINTKNTKSFFPYIYNEDWMFIMSNMIDDKVKGAGVVRQSKHEPWNNKKRIQFEQFGDIIAFGARKNKVGQNNLLPDNIDFWEGIYNKYYERLEKLLVLSKRKNKYVEPIETAIETVKKISITDIVSFIKNYNQEQNGWDHEKISYKEFI